MESLQDIIHISQRASTEASTEAKKATNVASTEAQRVIGKLSYYEALALFEDLHDLTNPQFRTWYTNAFLRIGREQVMRLAAIARADAKTSPRGYFSRLLATAR